MILLISKILRGAEHLFSQLLKKLLLLYLSEIDVD